MGLVDHGPPSNSPEMLEVDPTTMAVREHIEGVIEKLIVGSLDNAAVGKIFREEKYDELFEKYTGPLAELLADLGVAIQLAMAGEPGEVPSESHARVQALIDDLEEECRKLPAFRCVGVSSTDDFASQTYEEILAQAILNQLVLQRQCALGLRPSSQLKDSGAQTDDPDADVEGDSDDLYSEISEKRRGSLKPRKISTTTTIRTKKIPASDDDASSSASASTRNGGGCPRCSSSGWDRESSPAASEFLIEEKTEEVTVTVEENDTDAEEEDYDDEGCRIVEESSSGVRTSGDEETWSSSQSANGTPTKRGRGIEMAKRVPFPEYGLDIVEETSELGSDSDDMSVRCVNAESWEENWLFQRQRAVGKWWGDDMVPMLIPNPNSVAVPRIGDRDIDELSELSEHNSCGSLEFSSSSSSCSEEQRGIATDANVDTVDVRVDVAVRRDDSFRSDMSNISNVSARHTDHLSAKVEFGQKDSEYTEDYASYVNRRPKIAHEDELDIAVSSEDVQPLDASDVIRNVDPVGVESVPTKADQIKRNKGKKPITEAVNKVERVALSASASAPATDVHEESLFVQPVLRREPPNGLRMTLSPDTLSIHAGKAFKLRCSIEGRSPLRVIWFHNGDVLSPTEHVRVFSSSRGSTKCHCLHRFNTNIQDAGTYSVVAVCEDGDGWQDAHVLIRGSSRAHHPPSFTAPLKGVCRPEKREACLECQVDGYPEPEVIFKRVEDEGEVELSPAENNIESTLYGEWSVRFDLNQGIPRGGEFVAICRNIYGEVRSRATLDCGSVGWHRSVSASSDPWSAGVGASEEPNVEVELDRPKKRLGKAASPTRRKKSKSPGKKSKSSGKKAEKTAEALNESMVIPDFPPSEAPKPGSIAAREHEKWLQAVPIPNNPYSTEKLVRRISRKDSLSFSGSMESVPSVEEDLDETGGARRVNCGPKDIDPVLYKRDYYVKTENGHRRPKSWVLSPEPKPHPPVNRAQTPADEEPDMTGVVAQNIARLTLKKRTKQTSVEMDEPVSLPSVRDLKKKFSPA